MASSFLSKRKFWYLIPIVVLCACYRQQWHCGQLNFAPVKSFTLNFSVFSACYTCYLLLTLTLLVGIRKSIWPVKID